MPKILRASALTEAERQELQRRLTSTGVSVLEYKWAPIIWLSAVEGLRAADIAPACICRSSGHAYGFGNGIGGG